MNAHDACRAISKYAKQSDIKYCVNVGEGWVIFCDEILQPIFVNNKTIRGLNLNVQSDVRIVDTADEKIRHGDFY